MKKIILLLLFFTFFQNMYAQVEPRLVNEKHEEFNHDIQEYLLDQEYVYEYDYYGKLILKTQKVYDSHQELGFQKEDTYQYDDQNNIVSAISKFYYSVGEFTIQQGLFYEYNSQNLLSKRLLKRYNPNVDLWITESWVEFYYDDNGCEIKRIKKENSIIAQERIYEYEVDENCNKIREDFTVNDTYYTYQYPDEFGSIITIHHLPFNNNEYFVGSYQEEIYNEHRDLIKYSYLDLNSDSDTVNFFTHEFDYRYFRDSSNDWLKTKEVDVYRTSINLDSIILFHQEITDYKYYCDGLLAEEERIRLSSGNKNRISYFYEGKLDCFELEEDLSFTISPNPSFGQIKITSHLFASGNSTLRVFTSDGKLVAETLKISRQLEQEIDISFLPNGFYFIQLKNGDYMKTHKLIIQK